MGKQIYLTEKEIEHLWVLLNNLEFDNEEEEKALLNVKDKLDN